jgi:hypothetical protein
MSMSHICRIHTNQCCCKRADGRWIKTKQQRSGNLNGMPVAIFAKLVKAVESNTFESYIGKRSAGHLFKTIFP